MMYSEIKLPPHDADAEEAVLGSLLIDGEAVSAVEGFLGPGDFYREKNQWIYEACLALAQRREALNQITVARELARGERLETVGGTAYLSHLIAVVPTSLHLEYYAQIVHRLSLTRRLIIAGGQIANMGYESGVDIDAALSRAKSLLDFTPPRAEIITPRQFAEEMTNIFSQKQEGKSKAVKYGFPSLDEATSGMYGGDLVIIGGRPGTGKSHLALQTALNIVKRESIVLFASTEMTLRQIGERTISMEAGIHIKRLRTAELTQAEERDIVGVVGRVAEMPLYFLVGGLTSKGIAQHAAVLKKGQGLDIVFVDYLQLLRDRNDPTYGKNLNERIGQLSGNLKALATDLEIPVVLTSQFNREVERRAGNKPQLSDLRESGSLEQDADTVLLLHRPERYNPDDNKGEDKGILEVGIAKQRQIGDLGLVKLLFNQKLRRYVDLAMEKERK